MEIPFRFLKDRLHEAGAVAGHPLPGPVAHSMAHSLHDDLLSLQGIQERRAKSDEDEESEKARHAAEMERIAQARGNLIIDCEHWITELCYPPDQPGTTLQRCVTCGWVGAT